MSSDLVTPAPPRSAASRRRSWVVAVVVGVLALGALVAWLGRPGPDPDPGGRGLAMVEAAITAVPPGSTVLDRQSHEPVWTSCDGRGSAGWTGVTAGVTFRSTDPDLKVLQAVGAELVRAGWQAGPQQSSPLGPGQVWTRTSPSGTAAHASLTRGSRGLGEKPYWSLDAVVAPVGPTPSGC